MTTETGQLLTATLAALVLGLRHAADPDHLTAVSTLLVGQRDEGARRAGWLGLAWGAGHSLTLLALGAPVVLIRWSLPAWLHTLLELTVGLLIVLLALRLLRQWARGTLHEHEHAHGGMVHAHPHAHARSHEHEASAEERSGHEHRHGAGARAQRTPLESFVIGCVHGAGGSAGAGLLVVATATTQAGRCLALVAFAGGTALSMYLVSAGLGRILSGHRGRRLIERTVPAFGAAAFLFGIFYGAAAVLAP